MFLAINPKGTSRGQPSGWCYLADIYGRYQHFRIRMSGSDGQDLVARVFHSEFYPRGTRAKGRQLRRLLPTLRQAVSPDVGFP